MESGAPPARLRAVRCPGLALAAAALLLICSTIAQAGQARPPSDRVPHDLAVLVMVQREGRARVALSYADRVSHPRLRAAFERLGEETGSRISGVAARDERPDFGSKALATTAEFTAANLLKPGAHPLPVSAFAEALPEWRHMRLVFVVGEDFAFAGPDSYTGDGFSVQLIKGTDVYEYDVVRMNGEPAPAAESGSRPDQRPVRPEPARRALRIAAAAALATAVAAAAWLVVLRARRRARAPSADACGSEPETIEETAVTENGSKEDGA